MYNLILLQAQTKIDRSNIFKVIIHVYFYYRLSEKGDRKYIDIC